MSDLVEILITSDGNGSQSTCNAWNPNTETNLLSYKGGGAAHSHAVCLLKNEFLLAANNARPLIHIWPVNSQDQISNIRYVTPGKVSSMAVSPDGNFLIAGIQEVLYIWQICSGKMCNSLSKHYQNVTNIKFTDDGSHFISAGADASILVWNLTKVLSENLSNQDPLYSFSDHSLPISDIFVGSGGIRGFVCSVSIDRTCRIYDLSSGETLLNLVFADPLRSVAVNLLETCVYVGSNSGAIYEFNIQSPPRMKEYNMTNEDSKNKFFGHKSSVTCLALSLSGEMLASGGLDANVHLWHINSKQLLRTLSHKSPITNLFFTITPKNMFNQEIKLNLITANLKRMMDSQKSDDNHVVDIFIPNVLEEENTKVTNINRNLAKDTAQDIQNLRNEIQHLKKINKQLFEHSVKNILHN